MADAKSYDLVVIGAGPAGYVGAIRAAQLGLSACVIEKDKPGGVCLNIGCIPSKALIQQAEIFLSGKNLEDMGVKIDRSGLDYRRVFEKSRKASDSLTKGVAFLLKKNKIDLITGTARLSGKQEVVLDNGTKLTGKSILIATGSRPIELPAFPFDEKTVLSSNGALMLDELPERMVILGGGVIGCEFAHILNAFGTEVTIVEMLAQILPMDDPEISSVLARAFKKRGIRMLTSAKALSMKQEGGVVAVTVEDADGKTTVETADKLLVVVGRRPNTEDLGLEEVGIETEKGFIPVGDFYRTDTETIYAAGDVTSSPLLAHVASKEAEIAVEHMAGHNPEPKIDPATIPSAVYTDPQVASFGLNELQAKEKNISFKTASFPYRGAGKAVAVDKSDGFVKIVFDPETSEILGAQIVGAEATELIHEILLAKTGELLPEDIAKMIHAHPTFSEAVMEAFRAVEGWAIHI